MTDKLVKLKATVITRAARNGLPCGDGDVDRAARTILRMTNSGSEAVVIELESETDLRAAEELVFLKKIGGVERRNDRWFFIYEKNAEGF